MPGVTIVTPAYNSVTYIQKTIDSVLNQDYPNLEYIVVDGGSTDGTVELLRSYGDRLKWVSERDHGQSDAINKGWRLAEGEILGWLNADDYYLPGAVSSAVAYLNEHPQVGAVFGSLAFINDEGVIYGYKDPHDFNPRAILEYPTQMISSTLFFRKVQLASCGYLNRDLHFAMDYDFYLRLAKVGEIHYIPRIMAHFRVHSASKSQSQVSRHLSEMIQVYRAHGGRFRLSPFWIRVAALFLWSRIPESLRKLFRQVLSRLEIGEVTIERPK